MGGQLATAGIMNRKKARANTNPVRLALFRSLALQQTNKTHMYICIRTFPPHSRGL